MLTGEPVGGDEAERIGLVDHVLPEAGFEAALEAVVGVYLRAPRASSVATKHLARRPFDTVFPEVLADAFRWFDQCLEAPEVEAARVAWRRRKAD
jgi:enoyl-CoA hydratase/carnithine racemase